ncbi:MAG: ABC transporter ATP-binding protein [Phycisphaerae bacterium]|nr:ABC transporter ATP-binding protein [Phycisphaerae bacterium]
MTEDPPSNTRGTDAPHGSPQPRRQCRSGCGVDSDARAPILSAANVTFGYPQRPDFLQPARLEVRRGQCWGIIGPNGAGKSTLLRLLAGLLTPETGAVRLEGCPLQDIPLRQRARRIAFLPQHVPSDLQTTARDIVLMGRFPHRRFGLFEDAADLAIADRALATTGTAAFADRPLATLSGGEAQRVHVAAALAQQPAVLLMDEPTASLDLYHQLSVFTILRNLAGQERLAVVVVTHDVNLAARFCSHVLLLDDGRSVAAGQPADVVKAEILAPVYQVEFAVAGTGKAAVPWIVPSEPHPAPAGGFDSQRGPT